eukprot:2723912-Prymnesium_polylepis.4
MPGDHPTIGGGPEVWFCMMKLLYVALPGRLSTTCDAHRSPDDLATPATCSNGIAHCAARDPSEAPPRLA